jgi:hypothetical protein
MWFFKAVYGKAYGCWSAGCASVKV